MIRANSKTVDSTKWNGLSRKNGFKKPHRTIEIRKKYIKRRKREKNSTAIKKKCGLARVSAKQKERLARYHPIQKQFLLENPACDFCLKLEGRVTPSTEVHHIYGRAGELMFDSRYFVASCRGHRLWPHDNQAKAAEFGWMPDSCARFKKIDA